MGHRLDAVHDDVGERLLHLILIDACEPLPVRRRELDRHAMLLGERREQIDRPGRERAQVGEAELGSMSPGEIQELADDDDHAGGLLLDETRVLDRRPPGPLRRDDLAGTVGDHVERRAELMRDARREPADGRQAIRVTKLVQGRDARLGLGGQPLPGRGEAVAHDVELRGEIPDLVVLSHPHPAREVPGTDGSRPVPQLRHRPADEPVAEPHRDEAAHGGDEGGGERDVPPGHVDVAVLGLQGLDHFDDGRRGSRNRHRHVDVADPLGTGRLTQGDHVPVLELLNISRGDHCRRMRLQVLERVPVQTDHVRPVTVDEIQHLPRPRLAVARPDRRERRGGPAAELHILGDVSVQDDYLATDLDVRVPCHDGHHAHEERERQLARELHRPSPGRGRPGETTRVASIAPPAGESTTDVRSPGERDSPGGEQAHATPGQRA